MQDDQCFLTHHKVCIQWSGRLRLLIMMFLFLGFISGSLYAGGESRTEAKASAKKRGPQKSGFYDFFKLSSEFSPGVGRVQNFFCTVDATSQPPVYNGNFLIDCDAEVPHNETTIAVNPNDPDHAVGGYHSYQINFLGATAVTHIIGTTSVTFDGGQSWQEVVPPITPYQFTGDPALAFDSDGRVYFANIADHEGPGGPFTGPSVVVAHSDDGGLSWSKPVTVAEGKGAITGSPRNLIFQDKEFIATDAHVSSPFRNRVYVSWTSFRDFFTRSPIMLSFSDDGINWSEPQVISGFSSECSVQLPGGTANECILNQFSYPTVAPNGRIYVSFENFNTVAENQLMVVSSIDGGFTWSSPVKVDDVFDINYPANADGRDTFSGCQLRYLAVANSAADPSDPSGNTVYVVWADNRNGSESQTNTDVFLGRSTDGGATWQVFTVDDTGNDQFFPWVAVAPDGRVDVGYMDRSHASPTDQSICQYGFTLTRLVFDGGAVSSKTRMRIDSNLSNPGNSRWFSATTEGNSRFIGDYNGVAVGSDGATWSLWTDQRNIVDNPPSETRNHGQHAVGTKTAGASISRQLATRVERGSLSAATTRPRTFSLKQNSPNPFNPATTIRFALPDAAEVNLKIYDLNGREVRKLLSGSLEAGLHDIRWDATDNNGERVASGVYLYRLRAGSFLETKKMTLLK